MAEETGITVLHGKPDAAEIAAVTAVLVARLRLRAQAAGAPASASPPRAGWTVRGDGPPGTAAWSAPQAKETR